MEKIFQFITVILIGVAAYFFLDGESDRAFAAAISAACCFFLSYRFRVKERMKRHEAGRDDLEG